MIHIPLCSNHPGDINNARQNHPELVIADLSPFVAPAQVRAVLKERGINKWLRVRRLLIQLKARWKDDAKALQIAKREARKRGDLREYWKLVGYVEALTDCRQQVRALCHSPRDVDFPTSARDFGVKAHLPSIFPRRPHKRWFWIYDGLREGRL